ncbi:Nitric oxide synthase, salivary gland [Trachymyrmex septentrionalis]|uniref:Nitric oxide synthase n=1 Tax=Trachymyrmex septentrionalis TaxID=34720 RepID=A0A195FWG3_9HYME|nr:PREDICTED: nitric oxide synthase, salivary gland [Trachymyrmex septentrionalis]KYN45005.1 Nitric oxide synthase, salivary gland [Trachymyrmex septentrionalis]
MKDHDGSSHQKKPTKLRNLADKTEAFDSLHVRNAEKILCTGQVCLGSIMQLPTHGTEPRTKEEILLHATDFLEQYFTSIRRLNSDAHRARLESVQREVISIGTYQLTETELVFGAKLAWRNAARCIGRIQWSKLQVFDCRYVTTTSGMFEALCNHIKYSTNKGNIRSAITIFPQRTDGKHDYRVWNNQLINYAGYKNSDGTILGDPANVEFTEVCMKLGWKGARTRFDILPLVLSANGHDPDYFDIPSDLVLEVPLSHPIHDWFEKLSLKWFAVPAVSGMVFDCGGLVFTAAPFNGWYMSTEIGSRDLCDAQRYNMLETIATNMGLDTRTSTSLWKDKAMIEANVAVLHSFQMKNVTIVDHHTASESFMKHYENEMRLRNGCPADWLWIVPPISGSATPVFHQEMALYHLKPSYDAQDPAWKTHIWKKGRDKKAASKKPRRKFHFKQIARAVKFTSKLFGRALSRRIKATVLFATETGTSQMYAEKLSELLGHAFHSQVLSMEEYDISNIEHEALLLVITSTFGNGDPPENGEVFAQNLYAMKMNDAYINSENKISLATSKSFIKANSQTEVSGSKKLDRLDSLRGSTTESQTEDTFGPLSNVRFAVFALGSSAYPNFCAFGRYVDNLLGELGGERLARLAQGDEMCGQEQTFRKWAADIFAIACETFCLDDDDTLLEVALSLGSEALSAATVRFVEADPQPMAKALSKCHNRNVTMCNLLRRTNLSGDESSGTTLLLELDDIVGMDISYKPGDHLGVFACNRADLVQRILQRVQSTFETDTSIELQMQKQAHTPNGIVKTWIPHDRYLPNSFRMLLTRFLDITTPPTPNLLRYFASIATNAKERAQLDLLASDPAAYEDWRHWKFPNLAEVLDEFPSVTPYAPLLLLHLTPLQPRFYSISSSPQVHRGQIHLTVAVVQYQTQNGSGPVHFGVCSNYLRQISEGELLYVFVRSAPNFYMPMETEAPVILVGPGTGIAPFRGFWHHRFAQMKLQQNQKFGKIWLFFGCRQRNLDLYRQEKKEMLEVGVLDKVFLALSREPGFKKTYVQDLIQSEASQIYKMVVYERGHFYVCGDCTMAEDVYQTLKQIIQTHSQMTDKEVEAYMLSLRDENRYHEDIFGITLRTAEVHNRSRETARIRMAAEP